MNEDFQPSFDAKAQPERVGTHYAGSAPGGGSSVVPGGLRELGSSANDSAKRAPSESSPDEALLAKVRAAPAPLSDPDSRGTFPLHSPGEASQSRYKAGCHCRGGMLEATGLLAKVCEIRSREGGHV